MDEIKPVQEPPKSCPFCGDTPMNIVRYEPHKHFFAKMPDYPGAWAIECVTCEFQIFSHESESDAIAKWNRRHNQVKPDVYCF